VTYSAGVYNIAPNSAAQINTYNIAATLSDGFNTVTSNFNIVVNTNNPPIFSSSLVN
jgi:hypothetical protein